MAYPAMHSAFVQPPAPSPFQQATAATHRLDAADDAATGWQLQGRHASPRPRQHYLNIFQPLGATTRPSSSSPIHRGRMHQHPTRQGPGSPHVRIVVADDTLDSSSSSSPWHAHSSTITSSRPPDVRAHAALASSSVSPRRVRPDSPPPRAGAAAPMRIPVAGFAHRAHSSDNTPSRSSPSSSSSSIAPMRRLQRRSSSLLAATSATASSLWSSLSELGDRSRALLCRSSPVSEPAMPSSRSSRTSSRHSSAGSSGNNAGTSVSSGGGWVGSSVGQGAGGLQADGAMAGGGSMRATLLSQRLLTRSTAIRRSAARTAAVLVDVDATDSYDDLLALDQFNVKRAVKGCVLKALPCRGPDQQDHQQQHTCHICLERWQPPQQQSSAEGQDAGAAQQNAGHSTRGGAQQQQELPAAVGVGVQQQEFCLWCGGLVSSPAGPLQQQQQHLQQPAWVHQHEHVLQLVCWDGPHGPWGALVPAPGSPRLLLDGDDSYEDVMHIQQLPRRVHSSANGSSSSSDSTAIAWGVWMGAIRSSQGHSRTADSAAAAGHMGHSASSSSSRRGSGSSSSAAGSVCTCPLQLPRRVMTQDGAACQPAAAVQISKLPCGHEFCSGCIHKWLQEHTSCPVCRWTFPDPDTRLINR